MALASCSLVRRGGLVILLGIISGALFYGDAIITPALSVLSAIEGLKIVTPAFDAYVVPLTVLVLIMLFAVQSRGTASVAAFFGPIMLFWFATIAAAGIWHIAQNMSVLLAFNPWYGSELSRQSRDCRFLHARRCLPRRHRRGSAYADLGLLDAHRFCFAWLAIVLPALLLNYLGQGALVLANPKSVENPFFLLYPDWALLPMVLLATVATVIASQAVITGAYSLTQQAIQLGLLPRLEIRHTSEALFDKFICPASTRFSWSVCCCSSSYSGPRALSRQLRNRRDRHDGGYGDNGDCGDLASLELATCRCSGADAAVRAHRFYFPLRQSA